ncbi:hypothetical protein IQA72_17405, partial [Leptospira borgpetersenii serovar Ballum]|uniref:Ig-like domain-containing protein n=1 Tax=Leptospira borgpetersenii TaxID=174 RepID=UPI0019EF3D0D
GDYQVDVPALAEGQKAVVTATDAAGNTSVPTTVVGAGDDIAPNKPTVTLTSNDTNGDGTPDTTTISGKTEPNAVINIDTNGDGIADATTTADENGDYQVDVPALAEGQKAVVTATDAAG